LSNLFVEFYSEEIPARMQKVASIKLKEKILNELEINNFTFGKTKEFYGSKRIAINIENVSSKQNDVQEEKRGPRVDANQIAIDGFAKSVGVKLENLEKRDTPKGMFLFYTVNKKGKSFKKILPQIITNLINNFPWQKSQKWGKGSLKWVRPLKGVNVLYNNKVIKFYLGQKELNLKTSNFTCGHSFLNRKKFSFLNKEEYVSKLKKNYVLVDPIERKKTIERQINRISNKLNLSIVEDEKLLDEVCGLVEWPNALVGRIDKKFMSLPKEVLITVMKTHQKYFSIINNQQDIKPYFIVISNMPRNKRRDKNILIGNEKVLRSRLEDAKFFWDNDSSKNFPIMLNQLKKVSYFEGLGTLYDKSIRIQKIVDFISNQLKVKNIDKIKRAALLCKIDLLTGMVSEFPELQGIMGGYYSKNEGKEVSSFISGHYLPKGNSGNIPSNIGANILSLADKVDHLSSLFSVGAFPSSSKDPFGLRRSALSIIRILIEGKISINIDKIINFSTNLIIEKDTDLQKKIKLFIIERFKVLLKERDIKYDVIDCFVDESIIDLFQIYFKTEELNSFLKTSEGNDLKSLWLRVSSILEIEEKKINNKYNVKIQSRKDLLEQEIKLLENIEAIKETDNFSKMLKQRSSLKKIIDKFFEKYQINDPNLSIKKRRLNILSILRSKLLEIGKLYNLEG